MVLNDTIVLSIEKYEQTISIIAIGNSQTIISVR